MKYHVYCLFRPGEHQPCYVGATHQPNKRRISHARRYGKGIVLVVWNILDTVPEAARREADLIAEFKALGITLDNREDAHLYYGCNKRETWQTRMKQRKARHARKTAYTQELAVMQEKLDTTRRR